MHIWWGWRQLPTWTAAPWDSWRAADGVLSGDDLVPSKFSAIDGAHLVHKLQTHPTTAFQLELAVEINKKNHVLCVIATGMGKTVVLMAGALMANARGEKGVALLIVPTKVLVERTREGVSGEEVSKLIIDSSPDMVAREERERTRGSCKPSSCRPVHH
ncbi:hypothetical protein R3P38DRAFT_3366767 [Favolaschia claudopus]|uniref:Helicase/UvrB N-terminal domain-containing protein n=1 Tax=Favolaschia claudopus TaxID=2862362 RepID=A0AAW0ACL0_9AGAR